MDSKYSSARRPDPSPRSPLPSSRRSVAALSASAGFRGAGAAVPLLSPTAGPAAPVTPSQPQQALWAIKTYKKAAEPQRNKSHWDYLLEEAEWLSKDFKEERAWKVALAKKAGRAVAKAFADRERAKANGVLSDSARQRKLAAQISKEVLALWTQVTPRPAAANPIPGPLPRLPPAP